MIIGKNCQNNVCIKETDIYLFLQNKIDVNIQIIIPPGTKEQDSDNIFGAGVLPVIAED